MKKMDRQRADAEARVKRLPCNQGGTVHEYLDQQGLNSNVEDHGWSTTSVDEGFEVERLMILLGTKELTYRWRVTPDGKIRAVNGKARSITGSVDPIVA